mmetsp:Transcript_25589/g.43628  ORF Transcript_25589/g.43628 Transcript_25589/m.43628 type:complete len:85 (+) Transcript_25589:546-800(+)
MASSRPALPACCVAALFLDAAVGFFLSGFSFSLRLATLAKDHRWSLNGIVIIGMAAAAAGIVVVVVNLFSIGIGGGRGDGEDPS